jgi:hypothetical protein
VFAARAAGILPLGFIGTVAEFRDLDGFRATIRRSRRLGFAGASVIHPSQIAILNEEFRPSPDEVEHARRVLAAYDEALAAGIGAVTVDGKMIDVPVVERARLLVAREAAIAEREEKMRGFSASFDEAPHPGPLPAPTLTLPRERPRAGEGTGGGERGEGGTRDSGRVRDSVQRHRGCGLTRSSPFGAYSVPASDQASAPAPANARTRSSSAANSAALPA